MLLGVDMVRQMMGEDIDGIYGKFRYPVYALRIARISKIGRLSNTSDHVKTLGKYCEAVDNTSGLS